MKSYMASTANVERKWYVVDAADQTLGRFFRNRKGVKRKE